MNFSELTSLLDFVKDNYETKTKTKQIVYYIDNLNLVREKSNEIYTHWMMSKIMKGN